jgi:hypothetical protein
MFSKSDHIATNDWIIVNNEFYRMWVGGMVIFFKVLFRISQEKKAKRDIRSLDRDLSQAFPKYPSEALPLITLARYDNDLCRNIKTGSVLSKLTNCQLVIIVSHGTAS